MLLIPESADPSIAYPTYATLSDACGILMSICIVVPMQGTRAEKRYPSIVLPSKRKKARANRPSGSSKYAEKCFRRLLCNNPAP